MVFNKNASACVGISKHTTSLFVCKRMHARLFAVCLPACLAVCVCACMDECTYIRMYWCTQLRLSVCLPAVLSVCLSVCLPGCLSAWHACMHACMHVHVHHPTYANPCIHHTCMHTKLHAYVHTYMHSCIHVYLHTQSFRCDMNATCSRTQRPARKSTRTLTIWTSFICRTPPFTRRVSNLPASPTHRICYGLRAYASCICYQKYYQSCQDIRRDR